MSKTFKAWQIQEIRGHSEDPALDPSADSEIINYEMKLIEANFGDLPKGEVLIKVHYSSLNYKDTLSASGHRGITKKYPHTPGVDAAGIVVESESPKFIKGQKVLVTGHDLGMNTWGGFSEFIRVPEEWVFDLPPSMSYQDVMTVGTAGFTASQALWNVQHLGVTPDAGEILVSGATGGVGAFAVAYFSSRGYSVVAATRNMKHESYLKGLGAKEVLSSVDLSIPSSKPLSRGRWAGVVDTVGGEILVNALKSTRQRAVVTCCGMIASDHLSVSIFPFILRGVRLIGLDSAECPRNQKQVIWDRITEDWSNVPFEKLQSIKGFDNIPEELERMKKGETQGRIVFEIAPE